MRTRQDIRSDIVSVLTSIAPEVEPEELEDQVLLRDQVDLDSMDWLNFLVGIHKKLSVDIPESDYQKLRTLADLIEYVERRTMSP